MINKYIGTVLKINYVNFLCRLEKITKFKRNITRIQNVSYHTNQIKYSMISCHQMFIPALKVLHVCHQGPNLTTAGTLEATPNLIAGTRTICVQLTPTFSLTRAVPKSVTCAACFCTRCPRFPLSPSSISCKWSINASDDIPYWAWASYQIRKIAGSACAGDAGNNFPATAGWRSRHASRHVRDARAVMHAGVAN